MDSRRRKGNYIRGGWQGDCIDLPARNSGTSPCRSSLHVQRSTIRKMIFKNARLIFPDEIRDGLEIEVENGNITAIREQTPAGGEGIIDLNGNYLAPGFVDLHVHGALGRDTMEASVEAFRAICDYHAGGGTTSL